MHPYGHEQAYIWSIMGILDRSLQVFPLLLFLCQPALPRLFVTVILRVLIHFQNLKKMNVLSNVHVWWGQADYG